MRNHITTFSEFLTKFLEHFWNTKIQDSLMAKLHAKKFVRGKGKRLETHLSELYEKSRHLTPPISNEEFIVMILNQLPCHYQAHWTGEITDKTITLGCKHFIPNISNRIMYTKALIRGIRSDLFAAENNTPDAVYGRTVPTAGAQYDDRNQSAGERSPGDRSLGVEPSREVPPQEREQQTQPRSNNQTAVQASMQPSQ
ncbi:hypothetical protein PR048_000669 [Dryococelus australis]|uniref:Uncharacterized protein n=1 Tax=Dryococelus australis TaxID=614101 RepID=A0ABQ9IF89_9NEOP|nr:hypothetical protein PR048_000669 [Dryococelus australis]